jgi:hypothetical protein
VAAEVAAGGSSGGEADNEVDAIESDGEADERRSGGAGPSNIGPLTGPRAPAAKRARSNHTHPTVQACRDFGRQLNGFVGQQSRDRISRFCAQDLHEAGKMVNAEERDYMSDGDMVAVLEADDDDGDVVRLAIVEGLLCPQGRRGRTTQAKGKLAITRRLDIDNEHGRLQLRKLRPSPNGA